MVALGRKPHCSLKKVSRRQREEQWRMPWICHRAQTRISRVSAHLGNPIDIQARLRLISRPLGLPFAVDRLEGSSLCLPTFSMILPAMTKFQMFLGLPNVILSLPMDLG